MKKSNRQSELYKKDYPKTFQLLKDLEELMNESNEEYPKW